MYLAPDAPLHAAVLSGVPLPFAVNFDAGAVDQQVQRPLRATVWNVDLQGLLATAEGAEVGHCPVQTDQPQQALDKAGRLAKRHAEQHLHRQAGVDRSVTVVGLPTTLAGGLSAPGHLGIEPDRQRAAALERFVVGRPVPGLVGGECGSALAAQLPPWIHDMNPCRDLCNRAGLTCPPEVPSLRCRVCPT